jgi:hypothetical protein
MRREYFSASISEFIDINTNEILGELVHNNEFPLEQTQRDAWEEEIRILKEVLIYYDGAIYFEFSIPRMGKRIDVLLIIGSVIFVLEFKVGENEFYSYAIDQVWDYAVDLQNFHETSHNQYIAPILIATKSNISNYYISTTIQNSKILEPIKANSEILREIINESLLFCDGNDIEILKWDQGNYQPTPTIVEAAMALYNGHSVLEISRNDAGAKNIQVTSDAISKIISISKKKPQKSICFVTGVPGAGKTLVGLNIATQNIDDKTDTYSVFLSGNGPLVAILREALARDKVSRGKYLGKRIKKNDASRQVKMFIQNVHNFRDECLIDISKPPPEHVALFDEAQRAWDLTQTSNFMRRKKQYHNFHQSEPEFLISCLDRHPDWAVIVCLVGGGQEINTGESGISEWISSLRRSFPKWAIYISSQLTDNEYGAGKILEELQSDSNVTYHDDLHLSVSMRSFRSELVSLLVKQILDLNKQDAKNTLEKIGKKYPIVITRELSCAKKWLKNHASGSERYGIVVSSQAYRLKPLAIDAKSEIDPIHWFLDNKDDVRSSYYLEDVATEFQIQGLELDWSCIVWDGDFRFSKDGWECRSFCGNRWNNIKKQERKTYLKNAYRVLLTRARQGMVIVIPNGDKDDPTRNPSYYDSTFQYLCSIGFPVID